MKDGVEIDTRSFNKFAADCRRAASEVDRELTHEIHTTAQTVRRDAQARWSFSSRLPNEIRVRAVGTKAEVYVEPSAAPHQGEARAFEHHGAQGWFSHPVFGNWAVRVTQKAHPALKPALIANMPAAKRGAKRVAEKVLRQVHSHG